MDLTPNSTQSRIIFQSIFIQSAFLPSIDLLGLASLHVKMNSPFGRPCSPLPSRLQLKLSNLGPTHVQDHSFSRTGQANVAIGLKRDWLSSSREARRKDDSGNNGSSRGWSPFVLSWDSQLSYFSLGVTNFFRMYGNFH